MVNTRNFKAFKTLSATCFSLVSLSALSSISFAQGDISLSPTSVITVDKAADSMDGNCEPAVKGSCNLRAAVAKANASNQLTLIQLKSDSDISLGEIAINAPANAVLSSNKERSIKGNNTTKLFNIGEGAKVVLGNVAISNFQGYNTGVARNAGELTLINTVIRNNKATCFGTGAMTAFATCYAGAIENVGTLRLKDGVKFRENSAEATASTASFTNANASGGAIVSGGTLILDGNVVFRKNIANATANSGYHGAMPGGASAVSSGGAISNSGTIVVTAYGEGKCKFVENEARAAATTVNGTATSESKGGAVATRDQPGLDLTHSCKFEGNIADVDADVTVYPAP